MGDVSFRLRSLYSYSDSWRSYSSSGSFVTKRFLNLKWLQSLLPAKIFYCCIAENLVRLRNILLFIRSFFKDNLDSFSSRFSCNYIHLFYVSEDMIGISYYLLSWIEIVVLNECGGNKDENDKKKRILKLSFSVKNVEQKRSPPLFYLRERARLYLDQMI